MRWVYKLIEYTKSAYFYAYARESDQRDGIIMFDRGTGMITVTNPCEKDMGKEYCIEKAIEHFQKVIDDNFPVERHVDCG